MLKQTVTNFFFLNNCQFVIFESQREDKGTTCLQSKDLLPTGSLRPQAASLFVPPNPKDAVRNLSRSLYGKHHFAFIFFI